MAERKGSSFAIIVHPHGGNETVMAAPIHGGPEHAGAGIVRALAEWDPGMEIITEIAERTGAAVLSDMDGGFPEDTQYLYRVDLPAIPNETPTRIGFTERLGKAMPPIEEMDLASFAALVNRCVDAANEAGAWRNEMEAEELHRESAQQRTLPMLERVPMGPDPEDGDDPDGDPGPAPSP